MGYGDLNCQNSESKIPTPYLDQLASEGMRFTDAHSSRESAHQADMPFNWKLSLAKKTQHSEFIWKTFFNETDITLPQILKTKGYTTACIGKWHLGWN